MRNILYVSVFVSLISFRGDAIPCEDQSVWVSVDAKELMSQEWRRHSKTGFGQVYLDINGDGVDDHASLVVSQDRTRSAIRICLGSKMMDDVGSNCRVLAESENVYPVMGLEKRKSGCYDFHEDDAGNLSDGKVCSKFDALEYFRFGSSGSFFIYDEGSGVFDRYWDSY
jgi:hypothetical protein